MTLASIVQTNFTAGELSPRMYGRVDVERYKNGAKEIENCIPLIHGGVRSAPMLTYINEVKTSAKKTRLLRFEFSISQSNILEFGEGYIRFYDQDGEPIMDGLSPYEIATVYTDDELFEVEYLGGADTIFLFHESHPVQRLRRFAADDWVIEDTPWIIEPFTEQGHAPATTLTLSAATVGTGRTFTAGASAFLAADVGRYISCLGGYALITGYTSATVVTCTIESAFASTSAASGAWTIEGTPQAVCQPSAGSDATVGSTVQLTLTSGNVYGVKKTITAGSWTSASSADAELHITTAANHGISSGTIVIVSGCTPIEYNGTYETISGTSADDIVVNYAPNPGSLTDGGAVQTVTVSAAVNGFRSEDVGKFVEINGGLVKITSYTNATEVDAIVLQALSSDASAQAGAWTLNSSMWSAANGYPRTGCFFQQRLWVGGSTAYPHTLLGSRTGEFLNFELGVADDAAISYDMDATEYNPILHLIATKRSIIALTSGAEFTITGGIEQPITPTNIQIDSPTSYGANGVKPIKINNDVTFWQRGGLKLRAMGFRLESDSFASPDLTKLSEHITETGIVDMAYQQEPDSILWCVRTDGVMVTLAIDQEEGVLSWCRQVTPGNGLYESVCVIPDDTNGDQVWCVVKRTIDGATVRYIERYESATFYNLHSAGTAYNATAQTTWTGLDHLEGETIDVIADGAVMAQEVVSSGSITLARAANRIYYGLPVRPKVVTLNPEIFTNEGSAQGAHVRISSVVLRLLDTYAANVNGQYTDFRQFGSSLLDQSPPAFSGDVDMMKLGWYRQESVTIEAANALPFHLLAVIMRLTVNAK